jgi:uncharacterized protein
MEEFEWDEDKRLKNIEKHSLDFLDAGELFSGPLLTTPASTKHGEERFLATGKIGNEHATAIYTLRGTKIRLISIRRARRGEQRNHEDVFGE